MPPTPKTRLDDRRWLLAWLFQHLMRSACLLQDLMGNQSGTVCGNTLSNTLSHFRSHEGGHLHSYWARRSDVLGLSSHIQIYVHKSLYNTNLCTQRLVYINIIMCMCTCAYVYLDSWQCSKHFASSFVILMRMSD